MQQVWGVLHPTRLTLSTPPSPVVDPGGHLHVGAQLVAADEVVRVALDGEVVDAEEAVERDAVRAAQLCLIRLLRRGRKQCPDLITPGSGSTSAFHSTGKNKMLGRVVAEAVRTFA